MVGIVATKFGLPWHQSVYAPFRRVMEEVFHGLIWCTISTMLAADYVVRLRVVASRWNECDRYGPLAEF